MLPLDFPRGSELRGTLNRSARSAAWRMTREQEGVPASAAERRRKSSARTEPIAGRYEPVEKISAGGMGQAWRAYDSVLDRQVAARWIPAKPSSTA